MSLDPPVVLVCTGKAGRSYPAFAVNILTARQQDPATRFAGRTGNRFETVKWTRNHGGSPLLTETSGWIDAGSHEILLGEVLHFGRNENTPHIHPVGFCHGRFVSPRPLKEMRNV